MKRQTFEEIRDLAEAPIMRREIEEMDRALWDAFKKVQDGQAEALVGLYRFDFEVIMRRR